MITAVTAAAVPMPVDVVPWEQPVNRILKVGLGAAAGFDQCEAGRCVWDKDVTQPVAAVTTKLKDLLADISDKTASGTQLHDIAIHSSIIATAGTDNHPGRARLRRHFLRTVRTWCLTADSTEAAVGIRG